MYNEQLTQALGFADVLNSVTTSNNTVTSSVGINMAQFHRAIYVANITSVASGQINFQLQSSAQSNFNVAHNIAGTLTSNFNASNNNMWVTLEVRSDEVTQANSGDKFVRLSAATNGNTTVTAIGIGAEPAQRPASQFNLNSTYIAGQTVSSV